MTTTERQTQDFDGSLIKNLSQEWKIYRETLVDQIEEMVSRPQVVYDRLLKTWNECLPAVNSQVSNSIRLGGCDYLELHFTMTTFQYKLITQKFKSSGDSMKDHLAVMRTFNDSLEQMDALILEIERTLDLSRSDLTVLDQYSKWVNLSNDLGKQFSHIIATLLAEYVTIAESWEEFHHSIERIIRNMRKNSDSYDGIIKAWESMAFNIGHELAQQMTDGHDRMESIRREWEHATERVKSDVSTIFRDMDYEHLYLDMFNLATHSAYTKEPVPIKDTEHRYLVAELDDIQKKITELEDIIMADIEYPNKPVGPGPAKQDNDKDRRSDNISIGGGGLL